MTVGDKTVKINLDLNVATEDVARSGTDSEDFTSDSGANTESSTSAEDEFVLAMADCPHLNLTLSVLGLQEGKMKVATETKGRRKTSIDTHSSSLR